MGAGLEFLEPGILRTFKIPTFLRIHKILENACTLRILRILDVGAGLEFLDVSEFQERYWISRNSRLVGCPDFLDVLEFLGFLEVLDI